MNAIIEKYNQALALHHNEKKAASEAMLWASKNEPELFDRLNELAEETTFDVRNYGRGQFYSWANHRDLTGPRDPWPASRWPKAVLCLEFAHLQARKDTV